VLIEDEVTDEAFLLDLLNTTPVVDGARQDALATARSARDWLRERGGTGSTAEWQAIRETRDLLQAVVRGDGPVDALAPLLEAVSSHPSVTNQGVEWTIQVEGPRHQAVRAVLAWDALRRTSPGRLRACANAECALFLIDHSKPNNARWCSMAVCGNRMKARRHYERTRRNPGH
jgi:predicted RNA-binding Zn ribbon-like protein